MWEVTFAEACTHHVRRMHWRLASDLCAAVLEFARTGRGNIERTRLGDPARIRLWIDGAAADIRVTQETRTLAVLQLGAIPRRH